MSTPIFEIAILARAIWNLHSLNNEGTVGNVSEPRTVVLADGRKSDAAFDELSALAKSSAKGRQDAAGVNEPNIDAAHEALLSIEGLDERTHWKGVCLLVPGDLAFESREHGGAPDPVNSALNPVLPPMQN
jgi:CRISPR/Cas system-associated endonuclease Cas1